MTPIHAYEGVNASPIVATPISANDNSIAGLRPSRSPMRPITMAQRPREEARAEGRQRRQQAGAARVGRKKSATDLRREKRIGHEVVELHRVADAHGGHLPLQRMRGWRGSQCPWNVSCDLFHCFPCAPQPARRSRCAGSLSPTLINHAGARATGNRIREPLWCRPITPTPSPGDSNATCQARPAIA